MDMITFDDSELLRWAEAWNRFPKESGKWLNRMVNDMAFYMRDRFPTVLGNHNYTIRDNKFIKKVITVQKARPSSRMEKIKAYFGTWTGGLKTGKNRFSGFTEELGMGSNHTKYRVITRWGRAGLSPKGIAEPWARLHNTGKSGDQGGDTTRIPNTAFLSGLPANQRYMALVDMMASGKLYMPKDNPTFILDEGTTNHGLFRFRGGKIPGKGIRKKDRAFMIKAAGAPDKIQQFRTQPVKPPEWDWIEALAQDLWEKFKPDFMFNNYIAPAFKGIEPKKKAYQLKFDFADEKKNWSKISPIFSLSPL
jgi:hypothetical protein